MHIMVKLYDRVVYNLGHESRHPRQAGTCMFPRGFN